MTTKYCPKCKTEKSVKEFHKNARRKDGLQSSCKVCVRAYNRSHYERNVDYYVEKSHQTSDKNRQLVCDYLSSHPCVDCGETDVACLDFDHLADKVDNVSSMIYKTGKAKLLAEIGKCEVRCANCHRKRTASEQSWYADLCL